MFNSLRARLWLSYTLLIGITVGVVAVALFVSLLRNPAVYRAAALPQLRLVEAQLMPKLRELVKKDREGVQLLLEADAKLRKEVRTALIDSTGVVIADSGRRSSGALPTFNPEDFPHILGGTRLALVQDRRLKSWVYLTNDIGQSGYVLFVGMTIPRLPFIQILRNEVLSPLIGSGAVALLAAFLLAVGMSRWISLPLQRMVAASTLMTAGKTVEVPVAGPQEVKELASALNEMHRQVLVSTVAQRDFIANVSHELKTPLTSIQGFSQAILDEAVPTPEGLHQAADVIHSESLRMHRLVMDLLTLTRLEGGTADLRQDHLALGKLLESVVEKFGPQAAAAQVKIELKIESLPMMVGDGDRLAQVFTNLVDNAFKYTPPGGQLSILARPAAKDILVEVRDSGKGIPAEDLTRIFERFYQLDKSRRGGPDRGVGLGLSIARQIVLAHAGQIWVESRPGVGSQFFVRLPLVQPEVRHG